MIIRDNSVKPGDLHKPEQSKKRGEELILDFGRPLTEEEKKNFCKIARRIGLIKKNIWISGSRD